MGGHGHDHNHDHDGHDHEISTENGYTIEEVQAAIKKAEQEYIDDTHSYFDNKFDEYVNRLGHLLPEELEKVNIPKDIQEIKDQIPEEELRVLVTFAAMKKIMANPNGVELMDVATYVIEQLDIAASSKPLSTEFINSVFNFKVVYTVLFSLLDLVENGRYRGQKMSEDYKLGVIDSIIALKKYQTDSGFGARDWEIDYNIAADDNLKSPE